MRWAVTVGVGGISIAGSGAANAFDQHGAHLGAGGEATVGLALHQLGDHVDQAVGRVGRNRIEVRGVALQAGERGVGVGLALERHLAGEALVQHEAEGVEVGPAVEPAAAHLLRGQVLGRAHHHVVAGEVVAAAERLGDAEVGQQHLAVGRDHDVARLDVAVDEPGRVGSVERAGERHADVHGQLRAELASARPGGGAASCRRRTASPPPGGRRRRRRRTPARCSVVDAGDSDRLAAETLGDHRIGGEVRLEQLDGDCRGSATGRCRATPRPCRLARRDVPAGSARRERWQWRGSTGVMSAPRRYLCRGRAAPAIKAIGPINAGTLNADPDRATAGVGADDRADVADDRSRRCSARRASPRTGRRRSSRRATRRGS